MACLTWTEKDFTLLKYLRRSVHKFHVGKLFLKPPLPCTGGGDALGLLMEVKIVLATVVEIVFLGWVSLWWS